MESSAVYHSHSGASFAPMPTESSGFLVATFEMRRFLTVGYEYESPNALSL